MRKRDGSKYVFMSFCQILLLFFELIAIAVLMSERGESAYGTEEDTRVNLIMNDPSIDNTKKIVELNKLPDSQERTLALASLSPPTTPAPTTPAPSGASILRLSIPDDISKILETPDGKTPAGGGNKPEQLAIIPGIWSVDEGRIGHLMQGAAWAGAAFGLIKTFGGALGFEDSTVQALSYAALAGIGAFKIFKALGFKKQEGFFWKKAGAAGVAAAVIVFILMYKKNRVRVVEFTCEPWEPPIGGSNCDKCNNDVFRPCSEYRCKALGQACQLLNAGTNEEKCAWVNPSDVNSPVITPWAGALKPSSLKFTNHDTRPPSLGTKIIDTSKSDKCLKAFTQLEFGITLNEPAQCKIDIQHTEKYDDMQFLMGGSALNRKNHTQIFKLPAPETDENGTSNYDLILQNDGSFTYFIRCRDANGNVNEDEFAVSFCVDKSPDTTPPLIENTSILNNGYVKHGADNFTIELYLNELAECKWSRLNKGFDDMENNMTCADQLYQVNARMLYPCRGNLTGIKDEADNQYYFKCKDLPGMPEASRNTMTESFPLTLKGTNELNMIKKAPNETIKGSTATVKVELSAETDDGAEQGKASCFFSERDISGDYVLMFETNSYQHKQDIYLGNGNYTYYFRCIDAGGNSVQANTTFEVYVDTTAPIVTRVYKEQPDAVKVVTDEDATCVYSKTNCNYEFADGQTMIYSNANVKNEHFAKWEADTVYYVKCKDEYDNKPSSNECSIVAGSSQING